MRICRLCLQLSENTESGLLDARVSDRRLQLAGRRCTHCIISLQAGFTL